jgi:hypothetical protein
MNKNFKLISVVDIILASIGTVFLIGFFIILRYGLGLDIAPANITEEDKIIIYVVSIIFVFLYSLLIENILRWSKILIVKLGEKLYNKKHIDGFPVNETFIGYKYTESKKTIKDGIDKVNHSNDMEYFEDTVWYANMEFRQKAYNKLLRQLRKKLNKKYRKAKKKRLQEEIERLQEELNANRDHLQLTNDLLNSINNYNRDDIIKYDTILYELYDINPKEFDAQVLLDDENGSLSWIDKVRNSKTYDIITTWVLPLMIGVSLVIFGLMYNWSFSEILNDSEQVILTLLIVYLVTKIPTTMFKAFDRFPRNILNPVQDGAYIFKKYMNRKTKIVIEEENKDKQIEENKE